MNSAICRKTMENLRNEIYLRHVNIEKDYLECSSKPSYMLEKIFVNNLGTICKRKVNDLSELVIYQTLMLIKPAYVGMCILKFNKVFMHEFYYDYVKNKND